MTSANEIRFAGPDGTHWVAYEISSAGSPSSSKSLIFASDEGFRRVHHYPDDWRILSAEQLFALSWKR